MFKIHLLLVVIYPLQRATVKIFFKTLVDPDISLGAQDYYVVMLFFDLLCFITLVLGANSFGVSLQCLWHDSLQALLQEQEHVIYTWNWWL